MKNQATQKRYIRAQLEIIWKRYAATLRLEDHELVILAVPTYPANIEAVSALDLSDINDIMAVFAKHREDHPDELQPIEPAIDQSPQSIEESIHRELLGRQATDGAEQVGKGDDRAGSPQERAEPAPEQDEGDAAPDAMELMPKPVIEIKRAGRDIRVWADGRMEGCEGVVINRIPELLASHYEQMKAAAGLMTPPIVAKGDFDFSKYRREFEQPGHIVRVEPPYDPITVEKLAHHFGVSIEKAQAAQDSLGFMYRQRSTPKGSNDD